MKTVIMAGGKGSRIAEVRSDIPKPLLPIDGIPVLEREIVSLVKQGFDDILITVGHLGHKIIDYFGDGSGVSPITGKPFNAKITYFFEETPLGNAGALFRVKDQLTDDFLLLNGDAVFDIDFNRFVDAHRRYGGLVTLFVHGNSHPYDSGLLITDNNNSVLDWLTKEDERPKWYFNCVNAGLHVINKQLLEQTIDTPKIDLDRQILKPLAGKNKMFVYNSPEYVEDMGTPERYKRVEKACQNGVMNARNLIHKQKAIFLDRDGTINKYVPFLKNIEDFELLPGVAEAIKKINESGYLAIVVTNQPVIARGEISLDELNEIHKKMETLLGYEGAYINDTFICPHHPDKGFENEIISLKIECNCRKPKPGLLLEAAEKYNIDLSLSWIVGDSKRDIEAGISANCYTAFIGNEDVGQDETVKSLEEFVNRLLEY